MSGRSAAGLSGARVFVTGGHGFVGRHVLERLEREGAASVAAPSHGDLDLLDTAATRAAFDRERPDVVIHLAARVGGIGANQRNPGAYWHDNLLMGVHVLEACRRVAVRRLVVLGTVCAYPKHTPVPFRESSLWDGFPEETNAPYGVAKRALATGMAAYRAQYGLAGAYLLPANLYGPHDDFHPETSHVIPAMIVKCVEAADEGRDEVELWGTGAPTREFVYVDDVADAIVLAAGSVDDPEPLNLGSGREISMRDLAGLVARAAGYCGRFRWNASRPDGQPRRWLATERAAERLGWRATTSLEAGLSRTVAWYRAARSAAAPR